MKVIKNKGWVSVSIIMPCFNVASFIGEAIESIIAQSHTDWELIIIDDASTDETKQIINSYTDKRITDRYHTAPV
jgi:glycosyltransferase involved in cell wall biosynthesis